MVNKSRTLKFLQNDQIWTPEPGAHRAGSQTMKVNDVPCSRRCRQNVPLFFDLHSSYISKTPGTLFIVLCRATGQQPTSKWMMLPWTQRCTHWWVDPHKDRLNGSTLVPMPSTLMWWCLRKVISSTSEHLHKSSSAHSSKAQPHRYESLQASILCEIWSLTHLIFHVKSPSLSFARIGPVGSVLSRLMDRFDLFFWAGDKILQKFSF